MQEGVELSQELTYENLCGAVFTRQVVEEARSWVSASEWTTDARSFLGTLPDVDGVDVLVRKKDLTGEGSVFYARGCLVLLQLYWGEVHMRVAGDSDGAARVESMLKELIPQSDERGRVRVTFWHWANVRGYANRTTRLLKVPGWNEIAANYPVATREPLERLILDGHDPGRGQLLLWHGEPGCGKTYALRSLLLEWKDRYSINYVSDADQFFAQSDYMLSVLLADDRDLPKLLILEDAGEFLLPDARQQMGQGLSRLLNATDGLIGQGLKSTFLITTNEEIGRLHPAVSRPGRCAVEIEFGTFSAQEANQWLSLRGGDGDGALARATLADLFAREGGQRTQTTLAKVGF